ncbi:aldehyde dehydrogenase family protein [Streptomyces sp. NPDC026206]|uniref:aldehyde dehydrogenase family protein n=1 Tax=Streptomyces sp. NPDC026206 TaxID=3157089 RepID=UPI0033E87052
MITHPATERQHAIAVENPAHGEVFAHAPACSPQRLDTVLREASLARPAWSALPVRRRAAHLRECGSALAARAEEVAELLTREQGKPLRDARAEVRLACDWFGHTARLCPGADRLVDDAAAHITLNRVPHGVVAAIAPSNFPLVLAVCKIAPALLAGNTVVLKPSPDTPLSSLLMGEALRDALPPGVLTVVAGDAALGAALTGHPAVRLISFTGSVATGRTIARTAAGDFKRVVLELGGNDAAIVLPGADTETVARELFRRALVNSGQFCAAVKRVYVPRRQHRRLTEVLGELALSVTLGDGMDPATDLGPLISRAQLDRVTVLVDGAVRAGARIVAGGGAPDGPGHFYRPTVVTDLPPGTGLELDEQFGPVIPVIAYDEPAEAVERVGSSPYALGCSVWGEESAARELARSVDCGTVWINTHGDLRHDVPFGGHGQSGLGVEYGYWGLLEYTQMKIEHIARHEGDQKKP